MSEILLLFYFSLRDPNKPNPLAVEWPKFTTESGQFLELKTGNVRVIDTPNKERNALLLSHLFSARRRQIPLDLPDAAGKKGSLTYCSNSRILF